MPEEAVVARLSGDEFAVLLPEFQTKQAEFLMNLVKIEMMTEDMPATVSLVLIQILARHISHLLIFVRALTRMYRDKNQKG